jgi:hypothetical protein
MLRQTIIIDKKKNSNNLCLNQELEEIENFDIRI